MARLSIPVAAVFAAVLAVAASPQTRGEEGFFRPARDPALTSIPPPPQPADAEAAAPATMHPAQAAALEAADAIREAEEAMDRVAAEQAAAMDAQQAAKGPAITSPLDGTAPIVSPIDGTAPIISPVGR